MEAYEFQTTLTDGIIQIPAEYRYKLTGKVKVILLQETFSINDADISQQRAGEEPFPYFAVDTTGYVFNREEANER